MQTLDTLGTFLRIILWEKTKRGNSHYFGSIPLLKTFLFQFLLETFSAQFVGKIFRVLLEGLLL